MSETNKTNYVRVAFFLLLSSMLLAPTKAQSGIAFESVVTQLDFSGQAFLPLASDPANLLGDSIDGYGFVDSRVIRQLSSQRPTNPGPTSFGFVSAQPSRGSLPLPIDPSALDGEEFFVGAFFNFYVDFILTDVDSRLYRDFFGQSDGGSLTFLDVYFPYSSTWTATFDRTAPDFGLFPPPADTVLEGFVVSKIPLGFDINDNGDNDEIRLDFGEIHVSQAITVTVPIANQTVYQFNAAAHMAGAVVDELTDPPFTIGAIDPGTGRPDPSVFGGPVTITTTLLTPVIPEPSSVVLMGLGLIALAGYAARRRRRATNT